MSNFHTLQNRTVASIKEHTDIITGNRLLDPGALIDKVLSNLQRESEQSIDPVSKSLLSKHIDYFESLKVRLDEEVGQSNFSVDVEANHPKKSAKTKMIKRDLIGNENSSPDFAGFVAAVQGAARDKLGVPIPALPDQPALPALPGMPGTKRDPSELVGVKLSDINIADIKKVPSFDDEAVEAYQSDLSDLEVDFDADADEDGSATKHKKR